MKLYVPKDLLNILRNYSNEKNHRDKKLIVLDDVFDTGVTIRDNLIKKLRILIGKEVRDMFVLSMVFYKKDNNTSLINPDVYLGIVPGDVWIVYPHELVSLPDAFDGAINKIELNKIIKGNLFSTNPDFYYINYSNFNETLIPMSYSLAESISNYLINIFGKNHLDSEENRFYLLGVNSGAVPIMAVQEYLSFLGYKNYHFSLIRKGQDNKYYSGIDEVIEKISSRKGNDNVRVFVMNSTYNINRDDFQRFRKKINESTNLPMTQVVPLSLNDYNTMFHAERTLWANTLISPR